MHRIRSDIESLTLDKLTIPNEQNLTETLCFNNLKMFECRILDPYGGDIEQIPLAFGHLESITLSEIYFTSHWINIMLENKNLKKIKAFNALNDTHLQQISNGLPNLEYLLILNENGYASISGIVQFMKNAKKLKNIDFVWFDRNVDEFDAFAKQISNEWTYKKYKFDYLFLFTRKL